jgi:hypothetical protein
VLKKSFFGRWVMDKVGASADLVFLAAHINVSVAEDGSEADVIATFTQHPISTAAFLLRGVACQLGNGMCHHWSYRDWQVDRRARPPVCRRN